MKSQCLFAEDGLNDAWLVLEAVEGISRPSYWVERVYSLPICLGRLSDGGTDVLRLDPGFPDSLKLARLQLIHDVATTLPVVVLGGDDQLTIEAVQTGGQDYLGRIQSSDIGPKRLVKEARSVCTPQ